MVRLVASLCSAALLSASGGCSDIWIDRVPEPTPTPVPEECNGVDDNSDGVVDEGFADHDDDGLADCLDSACTVEFDDSAPVEVTPGCGSADFGCFDAWELEVEWGWAGPSVAPEAFPRSYAAIGLLRDTDGDGLRSGEVPSIVVPTAEWGQSDHGYLSVLDGATGEEIWTGEDFSSTTELAVASVDGDSWQDIVVFRRVDETESELPFLLTAIDGEGGSLWTTPIGPQLGLDLALVEESTEVVVDGRRVDGLTGELLVDPGLPADEVWLRLPLVLGGEAPASPRIAVGPWVLTPNGDVVWQAEHTGWKGHYWLVLEADGDPAPELMSIANGWLEVHEFDGSLLWEVQAGGTAPYPPCAADFDGDGEAEVAWVSTHLNGQDGYGGPPTLAAREIDGTELWSRVVDDSSGAAGCSAFDFDADGASEIVYADEESFYLFDGRTGEVLFEDDAHDSATRLESPLIADVDQDGSAEVVVVSSSIVGPAWNGVTVLGHKDSLWPGARPTWPMQNLRDYRFDDLGNLVGEPASLAGETNLLRSRAPILRDYPDLQVRVVGSCLSGCAEVSVMDVAIEVTNNGLKPVETEVTLEVFVGGDPTPAHSATIPPLSGASSSAPIIFEMPALAVAGSLRLVVDGGSGGAVVECDESNNELLWTPPETCP